MTCRSILTKGQKRLWSDVWTTVLCHPKTFSKENHGRLVYVCQRLSCEIILHDIDKKQCVELWMLLLQKHKDDENTQIPRHIVLNPTSRQMCSLLWSILLWILRHYPHTEIWWYPQLEKEWRTLRLSEYTSILGTLRLSVDSFDMLQHYMHILYTRRLYLTFHEKISLHVTSTTPRHDDEPPPGSSILDEITFFFKTLGRNGLHWLTTSGLPVCLLICTGFFHAFFVNVHHRPIQWLIQWSFVGIFLGIPIYRLCCLVFREPRSSWGVMHVFSLLFWVIVFIVMIQMKMSSRHWNIARLMTTRRQWIRTLIYFFNYLIACSIQIVKCSISMLLRRHA